MTCKSFTFLAAFLLHLLHSADRVQGVGGELDDVCTISENGFDSGICETILTSSREKEFRVTSTKNESGHFVTTFNAFQIINENSSKVILHFEQRVEKRSDGKEVLITNGTIEDTLRFHQRGARNVAVVNNGRTARRKDKNEPRYAGVMTNRPLITNELFEVRLDGREEMLRTSINIGVTTANPKVVKYPDWLYKMKGSYIIIIWSYFISTNGNSEENPVSIDLHDLKVGETVGVMRKFNGDLHMYINHIDQGPVAQNIPNNVYGCVDIVGKAVEVSILDSGL